MMKTWYRVTIIKPDKKRIATDYKDKDKAEGRYTTLQEKERKTGVELFLTKHDKDGNMEVASSIKRQKYLRGGWQDYQPQRLHTLFEWMRRTDY